MVCTYKYGFYRILMLLEWRLGPSTQISLAPTPFTIQSPVDDTISFQAAICICMSCAAGTPAKKNDKQAYQIRSHNKKEQMLSKSRKLYN